MTFQQWFYANFNTAVILAIVAAAQTVILVRYQRSLRKESSVEHQQTTNLQTAAIAVVAEKVDAQQARVADKVEATTSKILGAIAENTTMTAVAAQKSAEAVEVANNMNNKLIRADKNFKATLEAVNAQQEHPSTDASE